jgi:acyl carrier protein
MPIALTTDTIEARVTEALMDFHIAPEDITRDATIRSFDLDSIDLVELTQLFKDEYGVAVPARDLADVETVGDIIDLIAARAGES